MSKCLLSRQLQDKARERFLEQNILAEYDVPPKYYIGRYKIKEKVRLNDYKKQMTKLLLDSS